METARSIGVIREQENWIVISSEGLGQRIVRSLYLFCYDNDKKLLILNDSEYFSIKMASFKRVNYFTMHLLKERSIEIKIKFDL